MDMVSGYLELFERKYGFLRTIENNFRPGTDDVFVAPDLIYKYNLQEGVYLEGPAVINEVGKGNLKLDQIEKINKRPFEEYAKIVSLKDVVSISPSERLHISQGPNDIMGKALDMIVPIGKGQRGLIIAPPKSGKTTILKHMAGSIIKNHPDVTVFVLLVDEKT
jgi:transcription termination factor Rho